jgi:hypothetical protein
VFTYSGPFCQQKTCDQTSSSLRKRMK